MAKLTRRTLLGAYSGSLLLSISPTAWARTAAQMVAVRIWPATAYTRMTLESDSALQYKQFTLANPNRLVVDIQGASLNSVLQTLPQKVLPLDPYIASVRVGQFNADTIRVVLDLKTGVNPQVFTLRPVADFKHRLVVDLYPSTSVALAQEQNDPLMALLQDYSRGKVNSDGTTQASAQVQTPPVRTTPPPETTPTISTRLSYSTPATAVKTPVPSAPPACAKKTWCWPLPAKPKNGSTPWASKPT